jgi:hypothetical protein
LRSFSFDACFLHDPVESPTKPVFPASPFPRERWEDGRSANAGVFQKLALKVSMQWNRYWFSRLARGGIGWFYCANQLRPIAYLPRRQAARLCNSQAESRHANHRLPLARAWTLGQG